MANNLSDIIHWMKYARHRPELGRRESFRETVDRNVKMHRKFYSGKLKPLDYMELDSKLEEAYDLVQNKKILPSMRSMQFAGPAILKNHTRGYNCAYLPAEDALFFPELMFLLLGGTGVGYSVQNHHVSKLPPVLGPRMKDANETRKRKHLVADDIMGWADAVKVLMRAYFEGKSDPVFDFNDVRPLGTPLKTAGGRAPGPEPLKTCLQKVRTILDRKARGTQLTPLEVHDIACHIADAVLAGGIRRAAMISFFSLSDESMITCKSGPWWELNPQRGRANNSAVVLRDRIDKPEFLGFWARIKASGSGEPAYILVDDVDMLGNPCLEVSLYAYQFCNLVEVLVEAWMTQEDLNLRVRMAARIATCQAGYTDFHYLREAWKETTEKQALIGVGLTGIASGGLDHLDLEEAAAIVLEENESMAKLLGINIAARTTVVKPSGTASLILGCSSGVHAWHSEYYIRHIRIGKDEPIYPYLLQKAPHLLEDEAFNPSKQAVIKWPYKAPDGAVTRADENAIEFLERVKRLNVEWIHRGHRKGSNKNNVSSTASLKVDDWEPVGEWLWENRDKYTGISFLPHDDNDHTYVQAPFQECTKEEYEELIASLPPFDLTEIKEEEDMTTLAQEAACAGGACEIT